VDVRYMSDVDPREPESWPALLRFSDGFGDRLLVALRAMPDNSGCGAYEAGRWCSAAVEFTIDEATWKSLRQIASSFPSPLAMLRNDQFIREVAMCLRETFPTKKETATMLPEIGMRVPDGVQYPLHVVRVLEEFDGVILSVLATDPSGPGAFLERYCTESDGVSRWLVVKTDPSSVEEYLEGTLALVDLLRRHTDVAMLVDRLRGEIVARRLIALRELPESYLPKPDVFHDPELRPHTEKGDSDVG
jgi:hypothetical protein